LKSVIDLLVVIMSIPHVDMDAKVRAGFLKSQLDRKAGFDIGRMFGWLR
jgi:hypothetical protein